MLTRDPYYIRNMFGSREYLFSIKDMHVFFTYIFILFDNGQAITLKTQTRGASSKL